MIICTYRVIHTLHAIPFHSIYITIHYMHGNSARNKSCANFLEPSRISTAIWGTSRSTRLQHMSLDQGIQCHASPVMRKASQPNPMVHRYPHWKPFKIINKWFPMVLMLSILWVPSQGYSLFPDTTFDAGSLTRCPYFLNCETSSCFIYWINQKNIQTVSIESW